MSHTQPQQLIMVAFTFLQPTSASRTVQKGAYRGVQNEGVDSYGLFSLMVKTFCSGSNQAHCGDSTFRIHEMSKKWKRKQEGIGERKWCKDSPPTTHSCFKEPPVAIESEAISLGWAVQINEPVDH